MVALLLFRSSWRFHRQHPLQLILSLFGIILGVGIVTSVLITNHSAVRAFALSSEALYGKATHQIVAANAIPDEQAANFIRSNPTLTIAPVIESETLLNGELVTLIGLDPFRESEFGRIQPAPSADTHNNQLDITTLADTKHPIWASEATVERLNLQVAESIRLGETKATLVGSFATASRAASDGLLVTDISVAQVLSNKTGKVDRLEMVLTEAEANAIQSQLPTQWRLQATAQRQATMQAMTKGFQINLTAMSLLALLVGMFLIHNTMTFAVLQRREVFAIKRLVGIPASGLFSIVMVEALVFSTIASIIGLLVGIVIAQQLLQLTTQTINDLYFVLHVQQVHLSAWVLLAGLFLGIGSSVLAAVLAASEAATGNALQARRRSAVEEKTKNLLPWLLLIGVGCLVLGTALAWVPSQSLLLGFAALMIVIMGYGLCIPWLSQRLLMLLQTSLSSVSVVASLALGSLTSNMSRTGLAIAALTVAVSATLGVDIMIGSFRNSVDNWLKQTLQSDVYVTLGDTDGTGRSSAGQTHNDWLKALADINGVHDISTGLVVDAVTHVGTFDLLVLSPSTVSEGSYEWLDQHPQGSWQTFTNEQSVLISEPMAKKYLLNAGDDIYLFTENEGDVVFTIAGVYRDYGSSHGRLVMTRSLYNLFWSNTRIGSIGINIQKSANRTSTLEEVRSHTDELAVPARIRDNVSIRTESLAIFDRTFSVTRVLRWLTMGVAFIGIFSALLAMHLERARDFAVMQASGGSHRQLRQIIGLQSLAMGGAAGLLSIPLGWLMSEMLIHIINVRSFGWSMNSLLPFSALPQTLLLSVGSAVLAGLYPAWRLSRQSLVHELRSE